MEQNYCKPNIGKVKNASIHAKPLLKSKQKKNTIKVSLSVFIVFAFIHGNCNLTLNKNKFPFIPKFLHFYPLFISVNPLPGFFKQLFLYTPHILKEYPSKQISLCCIHTLYGVIQLFYFLIELSDYRIAFRHSTHCSRSYNKRMLGFVKIYRQTKSST